MWASTIAKKFHREEKYEDFTDLKSCLEMTSLNETDFFTELTSPWSWVVSSLRSLNSKLAAKSPDIEKLPLRMLLQGL
jgi:hypothetical protein